MSHFYAGVQGSRGPASRTAGRDNGIWGHIRGRRNGVEVYGSYNEETGDQFAIYMTGGSGGRARSEFLGFVKMNDEGNPYFEPAETKE